MIYSLIYTSRCCIDMSRDGLLELAAGSAHYNSRYDITGVLIFDDHRFFQVLEGQDPEVLHEIYQQRILSAPTHDQLIVHTAGKSPKRYYPRWQMHACYYPNANIVHLRQSLPQIQYQLNSYDSDMNLEVMSLVKGLVMQTLETTA